MAAPLVDTFVVDDGTVVDGPPVTNQTVPVTGKGTSQAFGTLAFRVTLGSGGVLTAQAFGVPTLKAVITRAVTGLGSAQSFGTPTIKTVITRAVTGLGSAQAFGAVLILTAGKTPVFGVPSAQSFGTLTIKTAVTKPSGGVLSAQAFGTPTLIALAFPQTKAISGLGSAQSFGTPTVTGGTFRPSDLAGLTVWLDASQLGLADGADVSPWPDLSGGGNHGNVVGSPAPKLHAGAAPNGKPVVKFTANEGRVRGTRGLSPTLPVPGYNYSVLYVGHMVGPNVGRVFSGLYPSTNWLVGYHTSSQDIAYNGSGFIGPVVGYPSGTLTPWRQWGMVGSHDGTNSLDSFYKDGVLVGAAPMGSGLQGNYNLSGYEATGTAETCDCEVAELLVYDHALTPAERVQVEQYLYNKWFVEAAPPSAARRTLMGVGA